MFGGQDLGRKANMYAVIDIMTKSFGPKNKLTAQEWGKGMVLFSFDSPVDRDWVIRNQPWHFNDTLFAIKPLTGTKQPSSIQITMASFWVRTHDLSMDCRTEEIITAIVGKAGTLECYEKPSNEDLNEFVRFKVEINIEKPLVRGIHTKLNGIGMWIPFSYESLPLFCYNCGTIGHFVKSCMSSDRDGDLDLQYGSKIKAGPLRRSRNSKP